MNISFKMSNDNTSCEISLNGLYVGSVYLDIWSQKWTMQPAFKIPYGYGSLNEKYDSSYEAGKEMVELYNFFFPQNSQKQEFGFNLDEILGFLKTRA